MFYLLQEKELHLALLRNGRSDHLLLAPVWRIVSRPFRTFQACPIDLLVAAVAG
jgi:hypothetical protein